MRTSHIEGDENPLLSSTSVVSGILPNSFELF